MKSYSSLLFITLLLNEMSFAQLPTKQWDFRFGGTNQDELRAMKHTPDGGYILGGFSKSPATGDKSEPSKGLEDFWIVRIDSSGNKQWDKTLGGNDKDDLISLEVTTDDGFILGGYSKSGISGDKSQTSQGANDYWMVKTDENGSKQWDKRFGGSSNEYLTVIHQTIDGGFILGGYTASGVGGDITQPKIGLEDYWIVKTDENGSKQWDKRFGGDKEDYLQSLVQTADGGYLLAGTSYSGVSGDKTQAVDGLSDYWILKTDANGVKEWDKTFGGDSTEYCNVISSTADGGYILGGHSFSGIGANKSQVSRGRDDYWIVKIDESGTKQWDKTFGGVEWQGEVLTILMQTSDGGYILGGYTASPSSGEKSQTFWPSGSIDDYWFIKTDASGTYEWDRRFGGSRPDYLYAILENSDHSFTLGGASHSLDDGDKSQGNQGGDYTTTDYWLVKTTPPGDIPNIYVGTIAPTSFIQGNVFSVPYTLNGTFNSGNSFYAILSMNSGSFDSHDTIGYINSTSSGTITATIPTDILNGMNYHVRVISSDPETVCPANEEPITVGPYSSILSEFVYGGDGTEIFFNMVNTADGGFVFGGRSYSDISGDVSQASIGPSDYWIIKTDSTGVKLWDKRFGTSLDDNFNMVSQTFDGGFILGGSAGGGISGDKSQASPGGRDYWIVKTDVNGVKQWDKVFGGSGDDDLVAVLQTDDGGYLLGGSSDSPAGFDKTEDNKGIWEDYWIVKVDSTGVKQWDITLGGDNDDNFGDMVATIDGGFLLAGATISNISADVTDYPRGVEDFWVVKITSEGVKQWDKRYGGSGGESFKSVKQTLDGGYILNGSSQSSVSYEVSESNYGLSDLWIVKIDTGGNKEWDKRFGGIDYDWEGAVIQTPDSGYLIGGITFSGISGNKTQDRWVGYFINYDYWTIRINSQQEILWDTRFGGFNNDYLRGILQTSDGNFLLGGYSESLPGGDKTATNHNNSWDFWILKVTDALFTNAILTDTIVPLFYTTGDTTKVPFYATGIYNTGNIFSAQISDASGNFSSPISIGSVGGTSSGVIGATIPTVPNGTAYRIRVISSDPEVIGTDNGEDIEIGIFTSAALTQTTSWIDIFPNPFSSFTTISFSLKENSRTMMELFDLAGKKIQTLLNQNLGIGDHKVLLNRGQLSSGIYFLKIKMNDEAATTKIMIR